MTYEVKMPQLGMNQDSAVIVAWLKAPGDAVVEGEPLFEVETDKATMEVESQVAGFLAGIRAGDGTDVPVGDVIAVVVETEAEVADHAGAAPSETADAPAQKPSPAAAQAGDPAPAPARTPDPAPAEEAQADEATARISAPVPVLAPAGTSPATGKVLASPKAKRLAADRGIDLVALRAQGMAQPIHAADLAGVVAGGLSVLGARVSGAALDALMDRSDEADRTALLAAFAAGSWRAVFDANDVGIALRALDGSTTTLANPDRGGTGEAAPSLALVDLCDTRLSSYAPAGGGPTLSVARDGESYSLTLSFAEGQLPMPLALALLDTIAARVEDPIRQLL